MNLKEAKQIMSLVSDRWYPELMCSDACVKFMQIMHVLGHESRHLKLTRPSTKPLQGHSSCEVKLNGDWICFDVAFDFCSGYSAQQMADNTPYLKKHPIYDTHHDELIELYNNIEYAPFQSYQI